MDRDELLAELRTQIADERVLTAIAAVPRELFVDPSETASAYANRALGIGGGQTISQPLVVARMCELLALRPADRVLDIGTGSGYHAAVLAQLCDHVWGIERDARLAQGARAALAEAAIENVTVLVGDGRLGLPAQAPFDAINVAAATAEIPPALEAQLADGGRLVAPIGGRRGQWLVLVRRYGDECERVPLEPVRFVPLR